MATDHRGRPIGNPRTTHGGHMPFPHAAYWREGDTWSTASALKRLSDATQRVYAAKKPSDNWPSIAGHAATVAMDIWNNPHPKEYR